MALPVRLPLMVARGGPGPVIGLTAAVHGDEINGIAIIHELFRKLDLRTLRGTVAAIPITNVSAFHRHQRYATPGYDLNHYFPGAAEGADIQVYAHRLLDRFVRHLDALIDLHTASRGRANCLYVRADMNQEETARMAYLQRPHVILHNPASDGTLRGAASALGVPAITVEVGNPNRFQSEYIRSSVVGLRAVLGERGMIPRRSVRLGPPPVLCASGTWLYTDSGGLLTVEPQVTDRVREGEVVAELRDAFGRSVRTYRAPFDGVVIGRAVDPVAITGSRILHLGRPAEQGAGFVRRADG
ncbi:MAG: succinylglutamate desuccinylase/aspartoacylase family protein [Deltaproteobacteria bacterium]|nr:succinylglutamate desuccinylase/aspartoacylase family protein [Deltaproteobacteria bacterium]